MKNETNPETNDNLVISEMRQAYSQFQTNSETWIKSFTQNAGQVHCGAGCFACCNLPIRVSLAEAVLTASGLDTETLTAMRLRAKAVIQNAKSSQGWEEYFARHRQHLGYCTLLDLKTGRCGAYDLRPARCRDTFSAMPAKYCEPGIPETLPAKERRQYQQSVKKNPVTNGFTHYIQDLEDMGESMWHTASRAMTKAWGIEIWGDFWVLVSLAADADFMAAVRPVHQGDQAKNKMKTCVARAKHLGLWHAEIISIEEQPRKT